MAVIYNKELEVPRFGSDNRKEVAKFLYSATGKFFKYSKRPIDAIMFKEVHLTSELRCDIIRLDYADKITILEVKSCREDFNADKKWERYLDYCDYFYFVCPEGVIKESEIGDKAGLIYVSQSGFIQAKKSPRKLKPKFINHAWLSHVYKKLCFRRLGNLNTLISLDENCLFAE